MKNYYQILEVSENASQEVIEKAYKVLARKYHPDTYPRDKIYWAESKFKEVTEAYEVLSNPKARQDYDIKIGLSTPNNSYNDTVQSNQYETNQPQYSNNKKPKKRSVFTMFNFKQYSGTISNAIKEEANKPHEERSRDLIAFVLTIIIVSILVFIFWKVPAIKNFLFP